MYICICMSSICIYEYVYIHIQVYRSTANIMLLNLRPT